MGHSAVYGSADVLSQVVNLLLMPLFVHFLTTDDYGILALLFLFGTVAKVLFRMGLDAGFFRIYYDLEGEGERRRLAGTVALFSAVAGSLLFGLVVAFAPTLASILGLKIQAHQRLLLLTAADVYLGTFAFVPLSLLRIKDQPGRFSAFVALRNVLNTVLKVFFLTRGRGVAGVLWSDVIATASLSASLLPVLLKEARPAFSLARLRQVLAFGLPKAPHGLMIQLLNFADRRILEGFRGLGEVGIYNQSYSVGTGVKFALAPFESAWQPFVYSQARRPEGPGDLARVVTYAFGGFLAFGLSLAVLGPELLKILTFTRPAFWRGAGLVPIVVLGYLFQGVFLLTSIGIGIEKKARYYPTITVSATATNLGMNFLLIPYFGMMGAAWATVFSYAVMAGLGFLFSRGLYPIPFETNRLVRLFLAACFTYAVSLTAPKALVAAMIAKVLTLFIFPALLFVLGFYPGRGRTPGLPGRKSGYSGP